MEIASLDIGGIEGHIFRHYSDDRCACNLLEARGSKKSEERGGAFVRCIERGGEDVGGVGCSELVAVLNASAEGCAVLS